jgi:prepilin-type N-terminal cleavage/methylation domain-containing protein
MPKKYFRAFSLAELLIALAILSVIAVFTVPKVLNSQNDNQNKAAIKAVMANVSAAYVKYKFDNTPSASTGIASLTPYMNYVKISSSASMSIDDWPNGPYTGGAPWSCGSLPCIVFPNGAILMYNPSDTLGGTGTTNAMPFHIDVDGKTSSTKSVWMFLFYDGKIKSGGTLTGPTGWNNDNTNPNAGYDPSWFSLN